MTDEEFHLFWQGVALGGGLGMLVWAVLALAGISRDFASVTMLGQGMMTAFLFARHWTKDVSP